MQCSKCSVQGDYNQYRLYNGTRYCLNYAMKLRRTGTLDSLPRGKRL